MFTELLAESEFPPQGYLFIIVALFSFLKWLFTSLTKGKKSNQERIEGLDDIYEQYREEISQRQTQLDPPPLPQQPRKAQKRKAPKPTIIETPVFQEDIAKSNGVQKVAAPITESPLHSRSNTTTPFAFRKELQTKSSLKKALILREILGPPKALE